MALSFSLILGLLQHLSLFKEQILKLAKNLSAFKAHGAPVSQHMVHFITGFLEHGGQPGASLGRSAVWLACPVSSTLNCKLSARRGAEGASSWVLWHGLGYALREGNSGTPLPRHLLQASVTSVPVPFALWEQPVLSTPRHIAQQCKKKGKMNDRNQREEGCQLLGWKRLTHLWVKQPGKASATYASSTSAL